MKWCVVKYFHSPRAAANVSCKEKGGDGRWKMRASWYCKSAVIGAQTILESQFEDFSEGSGQSYMVGWIVADFTTTLHSTYVAFWNDLARLFTPLLLIFSHQNLNFWREGSRCEYTSIYPQYQDKFLVHSRSSINKGSMEELNNS